MSNSYTSVKNRGTGSGVHTTVVEHKDPVLKKDWVQLVNDLLPEPVEGLDRLTIATLKQLKLSLLLGTD